MQIYTIKTDEDYMSYDEAKDLCAKEALYYLYITDQLEKTDLKKLVLHLYKYARSVRDIHWGFLFITNFFDAIRRMERIWFQEDLKYVHINYYTNVYHTHMHRKDVVYTVLSERFAKICGYRKCKICNRMVDVTNESVLLENISLNKQNLY